MKHSDYKHLDHAGIYLLTDTTNSKVYVGQAGNIFHRIYEHLKPRNLQLKNKLYRAVALRGWDVFTCKLLEKVDDPELLNERETYWIQKMNAYIDGYNICEHGGVTRNYKHTEETKQKMRANQPDRTAKSNPFYGKKHSEETKAKIAIANSSYVRTAEHKAKQKLNRSPNSGWKTKKVQQINPGSGEVTVWENRFVAADSLGIHHSTISKACRGKLNSAAGYKWQYIE